MTSIWDRCDELVVENEQLEKEITRLRDALAARLAPVGPIERDKDDSTREYIPLPGGWEIQTKGKGSSYRLLDKKTGERHIILAGDAPFIHAFVTRMAKEINAQAQSVAPVEASTDPLTNGMTVTMPDGEEKRTVVTPVCDIKLSQIGSEAIYKMKLGVAIDREADEEPHEMIGDPLSYISESDAVIAAIRPHIEAAERERCAKIADDCDKSTHPADAATAIRSGK